MKTRRPFKIILGMLVLLAGTVSISGFEQQQFVQEKEQEQVTRQSAEGRVQQDAPKVSFNGKVDRVALEGAPGLCYLTVRDGERTETVLLGSVRYLMDKDFSPKAGETVKVQGFRLDDDRIAARRVELPDQKRKLEFRDGDGRPLWSGGARNRGMQGPLGIPGMGGGPGRGGQRGMGRGGRRP